MVKKEKIQILVKEILSDEKEIFEDPEMFLVDVKVSTDNRITIHVDSFKGVKISDCAKLSKSIEKRLDRDKDDFELVVSSAGLDQIFKVKEQYLKNIGKQIKLLEKEGVRYKGELISVTEKGIELKQKKTKKQKQKESDINPILKFDFDQIKEVKVVITF